MNVFVRIATLTAATVALCGTAVAQQTLSFNNVNPPIVVTLTPSSTLGIATNGNVTASCVATNNVCNGMPSGGGTGGSPPTVSLSASNFSTTPNGSGQYTPGTTVTLTPSVSGSGQSAGEVCLRLLTAGTPNVSGWTGAIVSPFSAQTVTLATANSTYGFQIRCFSAGGSATSTAVTIVTSNDEGPPPPQGCELITAPAGYSVQTPPSTFPQVPLVTPSGQFMAAFPNSGGGQGRVVPNRGRFMSIQFTAPSNVAEYQGLAKQFNWLEAQQAGFSVNLNNIYVTVSQCPNDFRIPANSNPAPAADPTYATGCRNWRPFSQGGGNLYLRTIDYDLGTGPSDFDTCMIAPGGTYYFNFILAGPSGGIVPNENPCTNSEANACGIQMNIQ